MKNFIITCAFLLICYSATTLSESTQPHVGSVQTPGIFGRLHSCGAGILNQRWLITSANCLKHFDQPRAFMVRTGMGIPNNMHPSGYEDYSVEFTFIHPNYTHEQNSEYDIALLNVDKPIKYDDTCLPIGLYSGNKDLEIGTNGTVAGWIKADDINGNRGFLLRVVNLTTVAQEECQESHDFVVTRNMMCVRSNECHVDSGSPFVVNNEIVGISTGSIGCYNKDQPATLTRINQDIKKWVENIIQ